VNDRTTGDRGGPRVPAHLRAFLVTQDYSRYTPVDHAVWRFVMRQNRHFLAGRAHPAYLAGLEASGIGIESIPRVEEMNACLAPHKWGAVTIGGFIPGVAFYDFQGHGILPIATEIRQMQHVDYTPAPDIIHEAAGHAPILCDSDYSEYVRLFGDIGAKALATREEHAVFDAVLHLSNLLEDGRSTEADVAAAKAVLAERQAAAHEPSEAELIARLYWWTVEYGLFGTVENPLIYGAGLLSSVGESRSCLESDVLKLPFDLETCIATPFDITTRQPQLFVCQSFAQLSAAVRTFAERMAFRTGGTAAVQKAIRSAHTATVQYSSGLQVSGTVADLLLDDDGQPAYLRFAGKVALAVAGEEIEGQGTARHTHGFSAPVGRLAACSRPLEDWQHEDLQRHGILAGHAAQLEFASGVIVRGTVEQCHVAFGQLVLITWSQCTVTRKEEILFSPDFGPYDMAVGATIDSVFADAADPERYYAESATNDPTHATPSSVSQTHKESLPVDPMKPRLHSLYQAVRSLRASRATGAVSRKQAEATLIEVAATLHAEYPEDWLLRIEIYELLCADIDLPDVRTAVHSEIEHLRDTRFSHLSGLIDNALSLATKVTEKLA